MLDDLKLLVRELSEIYDKNSDNSYVSLYLNKKVDNRYVDKRAVTCRLILKGFELKNFDKTIEIIYDSLKTRSDKNIAVFASHKHSYVKKINLSVNVDNLLVVDSSPYIRPLVRIQDEWESFTLLLISSNYAKIYSVSLGLVNKTKKLSADIMNKHKKGGCSQARFNRLRRGAIHHFFKVVEEALLHRLDKRIIVAGPGQAKIQFIEILSKQIKDNIVDIINIGINNEKQLLKESIHLISEMEDQKSHDAVLHLKEEILKEGLAAYGINEVLQAVKNGQVELLIIEKDYKPQGWICENCQIVGEGTTQICPNCSRKTSKVDIIEEIIEFAKRTDATIEFTDDKDISKLGHVGAILRYK